MNMLVIHILVIEIFLFILALLILALLVFGVIMLIKAIRKHHFFAKSIIIERNFAKCRIQ